MYCYDNNDVLRNNIGLLIEGADHSKLIAKIAAKRGFKPIATHDPEAVPSETRYTASKPINNVANATLERINAIAQKNDDGVYNANVMAKAMGSRTKADTALTLLRIKRFWDQGKVKLKNAPFDVRDKNNEERNFNLRRAQQAALSAGTTTKELNDGRTMITTTTYDPIHHKSHTNVSFKDPKRPPNSPFKETPHKSVSHIFKNKGKYGLGLGAALGLGAGLYAWRKHNQNKNRSFIQRLFGR